MDAPESSVSSAVEAAWRIAARSARSNGSLIEPLHMLYGIFSLDKLASTDLPREKRTEILREVARIESALIGSSLNLQKARKNIRSAIAVLPETGFDGKNTGEAGPLNRSLSCRKAFEQAALEPVRVGQARIRLVPLSRCLLEKESNAPALLGIDRAELDRILAALKEADRPADESVIETLDEVVSVFATLNADAVDSSGINWARVGPHFGLLCELSWKAGTSSKIERLFEDSIREVMAAIPAAEQAAVLIQDPGGSLLLKAHFPQGVLPVSSSSARKAMEQHESFIWQRGEDLSRSQRESNLRAGIYAPIIAADEVFGAICLDANSAASRFTSEDLFLVTFLGHQLGLALANRVLEETQRNNAKILERLLTNFSPQVRERLLKKAEVGRLKLGGEKSVLSILCSDIRNFTLLTENMDAEEVVGMLNDYFSALVSVIFRHSGTIDKFIGDAILAVFGSPEADIAHAEKSLRAALEMQAEVRRVSSSRSAAGLPICEMGIGVHTGEVIHGFIGSAERMEFTVIGGAVNLASRFCAAACAGEVVISPEMLERVWKIAVVEAIQIPTKHEGERLAYRLLELRPKA